MDERDMYHMGQIIIAYIILMGRSEWKRPLGRLISR
jgi:hypothetical protein